MRRLLASRESPVRDFYGLPRIRTRLFIRATPPRLIHATTIAMTTKRLCQTWARGAKITGRRFCYRAVGTRRRERISSDRDDWRVINEFRAI